MMQTFLIPVTGPQDGKATRAQPWRPRYLAELGLAYSVQQNLRTHMIVTVLGGDEDMVAALQKQPDVVVLDEGALNEMLGTVRGRVADKTPAQLLEIVRADLRDPARPKLDKALIQEAAIRLNAKLDAEALKQGS